MTASYALSALGRLIPVRLKQVPGYRRKVPAPVWYGGTTVVVLALLGVAYLLSGGRGEHPEVSGPAQASERAPLRHALRLGVFEPGETESYQPVDRFAATVGRQPDIVLYYSGWGEPFLSAFASTARSRGAEPFVQIYPDRLTMAQVASGHGDGYLRSYAAQVRAFGHPVILSFAPEANGPWYDYGWSQAPPGEWVAAWRHVVTVFRRAGARNVTWLWTINVDFPRSGPIKDYWPGAAYVDWIGIDGYYVRPGTTFTSVFGRTLGEVRAITRKPVLLSETAAGQVAGQARSIRNMFAAIQRLHLLGLVWFDQAQHHGIYHQNWRLEGHPAAVAAFRSALAHAP